MIVLYPRDDLYTLYGFQFFYKTYIDYTMHLHISLVYDGTRFHATLIYTGTYANSRRCPIYNMPRHRRVKLLKRKKQKGTIGDYTVTKQTRTVFYYYTANIVCVLYIVYIDVRNVLLSQQRKTNIIN
jgi:hypothetical protein